MEGQPRERQPETEIAHEQALQEIALFWKRELNNFFQEVESGAADQVGRYQIWRRFNDAITELAERYDIPHADVAQSFFDDILERIERNNLSFENAENIAQYILHGSDSIEADLPVSDLIAVAAKMQSHAVSRQAFIQRFYGVIAERTRGLIDIVPILEDYFEENDPSPNEFMHLVRMMQRILSTAQGYGIDRAQSDEAFIYAIDALVERRDEPILHIFVEAMRIQAAAISTMQSDFAPTREDDFTTYLHIRSKIKEEHTSLLAQYRFQPALGYGYMAARISEDRIGIYDSEAYVFATGRMPEPPSQVVKLEPIENMGALEHLYRPEMQVALEKEMKIQFAELPFRGQQQLANFLVQGKEQDISRFQQVYQGEVIEKGLFSQAFFSSVFDEGMPDRLLNIAESGLDAQPVFAEYAGLVDVVDAGIAHIDASEDERERVREAALRQGKELLVAASYVVTAETPLPLSLQDVVLTMQHYKEYLEAYFGEDTREEVELAPLPDVSAHGELEGLLSAHFTAEWHARRAKQAGDTDVQKVIDRTLDFYTTYEEMNREAATMNADTVKELQRLSSVLERMPDGSHILDAGCGDMQRITKPLAEQFPQLRFTGVDIRDIDPPAAENIHFQKDDITRLEHITENSQTMIMMNWSVANDILGIEDQRRMWKRFADVLQPNGVVVIDIPYLEGGEGSYKEMVERTYEEGQSAERQLPYGTVVLRLPREDGGELLKRVHIFQLQEITTQLQEAGFRVANPVTSQENIETYRAGESPEADDAFTTPAWRTSSGKARITIIAQKAA